MNVYLTPPAMNMLCVLTLKEAMNVSARQGMREMNTTIAPVSQNLLQLCICFCLRDEGNE